MAVFGPYAPRCSATAKSTGRPCQNPAVRGYTVCRLHGANAKNRGGNPKVKEHVAALNAERAPLLRKTMKGNRLGLVHGLYGSRRFIDQEEADYAKAVIDTMRETYGLDQGADEISLTLLGQASVMLRRAEAAVCKQPLPAGAALAQLELWTNRVADCLKHLGIRRDVRGGLARGGEGGPQAWAQQLIVRMRGNRCGDH